jgi:hypothetical protein
MHKAIATALNKNRIKQKFTFDILDRKRELDHITEFAYTRTEALDQAFMHLRGTSCQIIGE